MESKIKRDCKLILLNQGQSTKNSKLEMLISTIKREASQEPILEWEKYKSKNKPKEIKKFIIN
tara:strand:- start:1520 stop:1708 length:189 start_codon:yes stop_codon:yes gene_type:complete